MPGLSQPFGKISEGIEGAFYPEVAYVRQADKVLFFLGSKSLTESALDGATIVESVDALELVERDGQKVIKDGRWVVEGPFQRSDVKNANQRVYPRKIWERLIADAKSPVMETVRQRGMLGHLEHPRDGRTDGKEGALVVTGLQLKEDGVVWGTAELLDTPNGQILQEYTKKKVRWGVSSRGNGSVDDAGKVNESDYMVETWDAVMRPSTPGAYPTQKNSKTEATNPAPVVEEVTEEVKACVAKVKSLIAVPHEGLDEAANLKLVSDLIAASGQVTSLGRSNALKHADAYDCNEWLMKKLRSMCEAAVNQTVDSRIDEALKNDDEEKSQKQTAAFNRVIESMQNRVKDSVSEADELRVKLTETEALLEERNHELAESRNALSEANDKVTNLEGRLEVAADVIAQLSRTDVGNPVETAVEEAIQQVPALAEHRALLEGAETVERFEELVDALLPTVVAAKPHVPEPVSEAIAPNSRMALPHGSVVSESIKSGSVPQTNSSPGARMAGQILRQTSVVSQKS